MPPDPISPWNAPSSFGILLLDREGQPVFFRNTKAILDSDEQCYQGVGILMPPSLPSPPAPSSSAAVGLSSVGRREARLRPEYARRYPGIQAGVWEPAAVLCDRVVAAGLLRGSPRGWNERALQPEHFEFRGKTPLGERPRREDR
jgi:hypothetical protein